MKIIKGNVTAFWLKSMYNVEDGGCVPPYKKLICNMYCISFLLTFESLCIFGYSGNQLTCRLAIQFHSAAFLDNVCLCSHNLFEMFAVNTPLLSASMPNNNNNKKFTGLLGQSFRCACPELSNTHMPRTVTSVPNKTDFFHEPNLNFLHNAGCS